MSKLAKKLTEYVICKGMVNEVDRNIYEYGFTITLELGVFIIFCLIISVSLSMVIEGLLFFVIFSPLRSYAGGLHMGKFLSCFILSCLTFSVILVLTDYLQIPAVVSFTALLVMELAVYIMYPVENINRIVDKDENKYFRKKLIKFLGIDIVFGLLCVAAEKDNYLQEIVLIFFMVVITMVIGKYRNRKQDICH